MSTCSVCGEHFSDDIRFLNHMMEKHGFRNPNIDKPDRNSRGYKFRSDILIFLLLVRRLAERKKTALGLLQPSSQEFSTILFCIYFLLTLTIAENNGPRAALPPYAVLLSINQNISNAFESRVLSLICLPKSV